MDRLEAPGSKTECYLENKFVKILWGTYLGVTCIAPPLKSMLARFDDQRTGQGFATLGGAKARCLCEDAEHAVTASSTRQERVQDGPSGEGGTLGAAAVAKSVAEHGDPVLTKENLPRTSNSSPSLDPIGR